MAQNLKGVMSEALLSRFDIVFLMRTEDDPNQELVFEELYGSFFLAFFSGMDEIVNHLAEIRCSF